MRDKGQHAPSESVSETPFFRFDMKAPSPQNISARKALTHRFVLYSVLAFCGAVAWRTVVVASFPAASSASMFAGAIIGISLLPAFFDYLDKTGSSAGLAALAAFAAAGAAFCMLGIA
jgi:hypothetical protein